MIGRATRVIMGGPRLLFHRPFGGLRAMSRLLTIAIPTYNRSARFERQLGWLARNLQGLEERCAVMISDNASRDDTQRVAET